MTTTNDIDAIRARADAATKGPWTTGVRWEDPCDVYWLPINSPSTNAEEPHQPDRVALIRYETCGFQFPHFDALSDAAFIAHARQDIPALLAKVDELTAELAKARAALTDANRQRTVAEATTEALKRDNAGYATQVEQMRAELEHRRVEVAELRATLQGPVDADDNAKYGIGKPRHHAPNGCDDCSVEPGDWHRYPECPGNLRAIEREKAEVAS